MKIIFLDIDGVMNSEKSLNDFFEQDGEERFEHWIPHPMHVKWLNKITDETGAKIVISSPWRTNRPTLD